MATLEQLFREYARAHPKRDGGTWNQWCGSLMFRLCDAYGSAPTGDVSSAWTVWKRTPTAGTDPAQAPQGAFHFWDIGGPSNGHVGIDLRGGGTHVGMATSALAESLGDDIGINSVNGYTRAKGARYVGWCNTYANGDVTRFDAGTGGGGGDIDYAYGLTNAAVAKAQAALKKLGRLSADYDVDGVAGPIFVKAMQQYLKDRGFLAGDYDVDGVPGPLYGLAVQKLGQADGNYTGDMDGAPGALTSTSIIVWADKVLAGTPKPPDPKPPVDPWATLPTLDPAQIFVIDIATPQKDFDFVKFAAAGGKGVIVKFGGANASDSPYESPFYREQIKRARAAGLPVGHYFFNGAKNGLTPETAADYFAKHVDLKPGEILALDVEDETATSTKRWTADEARRFTRRVQDTFPGVKLLIYMSRSVIDQDDWSGLLGDGHGLWVAMYGANDGTIPADKPVPGEWGKYAMWQYTSARTVPGSAVNVDCNIASKDLWALYGYVPQPVDPEPEPEPGDSTGELMAEYLTKAAALAADYAGKLAA